MKTHAFVRSNVPQAIHYGRVVRSTNTNRLHVVVDDDAFCPDFSKFLYFLFAPTLIYRNSYPRCVHIDSKTSLVFFLFQTMFSCSAC